MAIAERPPWCPHPTCTPIIGSQNQLCVGRLPAPENHGGVANTHRLCMAGAPDDGSWVFDLQINKGDAWHLRRLLNHVFWPSRDDG